MNGYGALVEWYWQGKTEVLGEKHYIAWVVGEWMGMEHWWNGTERGKLKYWEKHYIVWVVGEWMGMEHWWNGTDRGKLKYWDRNLSQCHRVHHKCHTDWPGIESGLPRLKLATSRPYLTDSRVHRPTQCTTTKDFSSADLPVRTGSFCHSAQNWKARVQLNSLCTPLEQFCSTQRHQTQR